MTPKITKWNNNNNNKLIFGRSVDTSYHHIFNCWLVAHHLVVSRRGFGAKIVHTKTIIVECMCVNWFASFSNSIWFPISFWELEIIHRNTQTTKVWYQMLFNNILNFHSNPRSRCSVDALIRAFEWNMRTKLFICQTFSIVLDIFHRELLCGNWPMIKWVDCVVHFYPSAAKSQCLLWFACARP